jgi:mannose-6-phosphate isomerase
MAPLYSLKFHPLLKRYLWGGRRLGTVLGKPIGPGDDYAESWEVADHDQGQSIVANGPLAGKTLRELVQTRGPELLGRHAPQSRFPLIFKYLDCNRDLSVQVHPDDTAAAELTPPDLGKTEAWLILDAQPGSRVYAGLKAGFDRAALEREVLKGRMELCLHSFEAAAGQCLFIPAGTVHALGAGLLVAEIQQASDTTYRLHDWNRVGPDGQQRKLHIDEGLAVIDYSAVQILPQRDRQTYQAGVQRLVTCDKFILDRRELSGPQSLGGDNRFHIVSVLAGDLLLGASPPDIESGSQPGASTGNEVSLLSLTRGQTVLIPASLPSVALSPRERCTLLDMYLP